MNSRKTEILTTAAQLFKEKGYSAVSMRDLATKMGIKAASLYNHIQSKQEILSTIVINVAEEFTRGMNSIVDLNLSPTKKIEAIMALHIDVTLLNTDALASLNHSWMHLEEKNLQYFEKMRDDYEAHFRTIIKTGIETGEFKNTNIEIMLFSLLSTLNSLYLWITKKENIDNQTLKEDMISTLLKGIVK